MKRPGASLLLALLLLAPAASIAGDDSFNELCPVMRGKRIRKSVFSVYEGKEIHFCCAKCKRQWDEDPAKYVGNVPELKKPEPGAEVGKKAPDFALKDTDGKDVKLADFKGRIVVLQWVNPGSKACARVCTGVVAKMAKDLKAIKDNVVMLAISSNDGVDAKALARYLADKKVEAKGLMDGDGKTGKAYGAKTTPTCCVLDGEGVLRYSGAIDDDADGKKGDKAVNYVVQAVKAIAGGEKVATETAKAYGEEIPFKK